MYTLTIFFQKFNTDFAKVILYIIDYYACTSLTTVHDRNNWKSWKDSKSVFAAVFTVFLWLYFLWPYAYSFDKVINTYLRKQKQKTKVNSTLKYLIWCSQAYHSFCLLELEKHVWLIFLNGFCIILLTTAAEKFNLFLSPWWERINFEDLIKSNNTELLLRITTAKKLSFNLFLSSAPFLYLLKTSENLEVFWCFQGLKKGFIGNEWVNEHVPYP